jgi:hypothetical protein
MDGAVILNYESAEKTIADRKGIEIPTTSTHAFQQQDINPSQKKIKEFVSSSKPKSEESKQKIEEINNQEKTEKPIVEKKKEEQVEIKKEEIKEEAADQKELPDIKETPVAEQKPQQEQTEERPPLPKVNDNLIVEAEKKLHEKPEYESTPVIRRPIESFVASETLIDKQTVEHFYKTIDDDFNIIENIVNKGQIDTLGEKSLNKIIITLKIISKNPILKKLDTIKNLIEQVIKGISFLHDNLEQFKDNNEVVEKTKEMLNYIKKENILFNSDLIIEKVNEMGIRLFRLENSINKKEEKYNSEIALIRQKIADKKILKGKHISEVLQKSGGE